MDARNFGVDEQDKTVLMGFGSISFLPRSFAMYTLLDDGFAAIPEALGWSGANMGSMAAIAAVLGKIAEPSLGVSTCT